MTFDVQQLFDTITERIQRTATVKTVYGDPVSLDGRTIIPVARVRYGFGGGGGSQDGRGAAGEVDGPGGQKGGGGGGGVEVSPVGYIEVTAEGSRYVSFEDRKRLIRGVLVLAGLVMYLWWRRRKA